MAQRIKEKIELSVEQRAFIDKAKEGANILVDACIGSGKTTAIQHLCNELSRDLRILYLTYNKLLKVDAKSKIKKENVTVTNYHGFAYNSLIRMDIKAGLSDLIQVFNLRKPEIFKYDVLIIDEYQDIEQELAEMLEYIKSKNPKMQIIAVGDMEQKIYDKTTLDVSKFIKEFLGVFTTMQFTQCFRLSAGLASMLGRVWGKEIVGVNENCVVEKMHILQVADFLAKQNTKDILCLGERMGALSQVLNNLEESFPEKFNKATVYASIKDKDANVEPKKTAAIFTTYDSSKGLERNICVVFDFTEAYWNSRINNPQQSYQILRNIFCVAASRGKRHIIFVESNKQMLSEETLKTEIVKATDYSGLKLGISDMFDFKYKEDVETCFKLLKIKPLTKSKDKTIIDVKRNDALIDLSPCVGTYQEAFYFDNYDIDKELNLLSDLFRKRKYLYTERIKTATVEEKILISTAMETNQDRYVTQVTVPFITEEEKMQIAARLATRLKRSEEVQKKCCIEFSDKPNGKLLFSALGFADVVKKKTVYELKFVSELQHEHFLQCVCYMVALGLKKGILWNIRDNSCYQIKISNKAKFLDAVANAITKQKVTKYYKPKRNEDGNFCRNRYGNKLERPSYVYRDCGCGNANLPLDR